MRKEYRLAPNFEIPPPPDGPLKLGHILDDPDDPRYPLNLDAVVSPLASPEYKRFATGVTASRSKLGEKEFRLWASLTQLIPIGGDATVARNKSSSDVFQVKSIETTFFLPTKPYLEASLKHDDVKRYMEGGLWRNDIWMITGLKVAYGASVTSGSSLENTAAGAATLDLAQLGLPGSAGAKASSKNAAVDSTHVSHLQPFVLAYQVRKVLYKKKTGARTEADNRGAVFGHEARVIVTDEDVTVEGIEEDLASVTEVADPEECVFIPLLDDNSEEMDRIMV